MKTKTIILFDFDGTVFDSQEAYDAAASQSLLEINPKYTIEFCSTFFNGRGWTEVFKEIGKLEKGYDVESSFKKALDLAAKITKMTSKPNPNAKEVIKKLKDEGFKIAICSNSSFKALKEHLAICELENIFEDKEIFSKESVKFGKPSPEIYNKAKDYFKAKNEECLIIEDSFAGLVSASKAKIDALLYTGGSHHKKNPDSEKNILEALEKTKNNKPKGVINNLLEIYNFL